MIGSTGSASRYGVIMWGLWDDLLGEAEELCVRMWDFSLPCWLSKDNELRRPRPRPRSRSRSRSRPGFSSNTSTVAMMIMMIPPLFPFTGTALAAPNLIPDRPDDLASSTADRIAYRGSGKVVKWDERRNSPIVQANHPYIRASILHKV